MDSLKREQLGHTLLKTGDLQLVELSFPSAMKKMIVEMRNYITEIQKLYPNVLIRLHAAQYFLSHIHSSYTYKEGF